MVATVEMPKDWGDAAGWDAYYESRVSQPTSSDSWDAHTGSISLDRLPDLVEDLKARGWREIWVPGCGLSPLARAIAHLGLNSIATDVSPVAVRFQRERSDVFATVLSELGPAEPTGSFTAEIHDFRNEYRQEAFDLIINVKAFQAFSTPDMTSIARVHAAALRKGRYAYFDTMNVQGQARDRLEMALEDGGFVVPWIALDRWYRQELESTGIPHMFILGQPMIPFDGEYSSDSPKRERATAILREITAEYERRGEAEKEAEEKRQSPDAKVAQVIYSTG